MSRSAKSLVGTGMRRRVRIHRRRRRRVVLPDPAAAQAGQPRVRLHPEGQRRRRLRRSGRGDRTRRCWPVTSIVEETAASVPYLDVRTRPRQAARPRRPDPRGVGRPVRWIARRTERGGDKDSDFFANQNSAVKLTHGYTRSGSSTRRSRSILRTEMRAGIFLLEPGGEHPAQLGVRVRSGSQEVRVVTARCGKAATSFVAGWTHPNTRTTSSYSYLSSTSVTSTRGSRTRPSPFPKAPASRTWSPSRGEPDIGDHVLEAGAFGTVVGAFS